MAFGRRSDNSHATVRAAKDRRDEDAVIDDRTTPQERQDGVSNPLHRKAIREGRYCPGEGKE